MLQQWRAVGNTVTDLTGPRFTPQAFRSRDERVTTRPTGRFLLEGKYEYVAENKNKKNCRLHNPFFVCLFVGIQLSFAKPLVRDFAEQSKNSNF